MNAIPWALPLLAISLVACQQAAAPGAAATPAAATNDLDLIARGEYLVKIAGCNDCHTPGYPEAAGKIPKEQWLVGTPLGWNGPWGTTYAPNLRLTIKDMDEAAWLKYSAVLHTRPPMPDFALREMTEEDRTAIYRLIRSLGPAGQPAPAYLPPGHAPQAPYVQWVLPAPPAPGIPATKG